MAKVFTITQGLENMGALKTGGQGSVYKGRRIGEIITAVKLLPTPIYSESTDDKNFMDFQNEVEKLKKVNLEPNPHVVKILNSGLTESGNLPFIEMEFIEGPDMEDLLKPPHEPLFSIKELIKVADQLSYALAHCHRVNVKHGDIKSNNVKFNVNTGNYILLDFGLAIMSEEQRRTSMRQVGAIEFMAPEQNDGLMFFQTDIYSFGIILFEILTGRVPFPLKDKTETARNKVMLAHLEAPVPDVLSLRRLMLPPKWSDEKQEREMQVPEWLITTINKCLEKSPNDRFKNGMELHQYIVHHSTITSGSRDSGAMNTMILQSENERLRTLVLKYQEDAKHREASGVISNKHKVLSLNEVLSHKVIEQPEPVPASAPEIAVAPIKRRRPVIDSMLYFLLLISTAAVVYIFRDKINVLDKFFTGSGKPQVVADTIPKPLPPPTQYKVQVAKAYFHNTPAENTKRVAYMINSGDVLTPLKETNDFIYIEFTNGTKISKGWLRKKDLATWEDSSKSRINSPTGDGTENNREQEDAAKFASQ
ncbi:MAG: serine/threonine-protein kinase [Ferruginibacter sp.]